MMHWESLLPNLVSRNHYHYLVNRRRRRLAVLHAQPPTATHCTKQLSVIAHHCPLDSICILLILLCSFSLSLAVQTPADQQQQEAAVDPFRASSSLSTTQCVIGRLRQCYEDEDCVENEGPKLPEVKVVVTNRNSTEDVHVHSPRPGESGNIQVNNNNSERMGTCTCRMARRCKRNQQSPKNVPMGERGRLADQRTKQSGHLGWIIGTLLALTIVGGCAFAIYYYGIRYGMIRSIARQLGLTDNTQVEHQLLNRIPSSADDETELAI